MGMEGSFNKRTRHIDGNYSFIPPTGRVGEPFSVQEYLEPQRPSAKIMINAEAQAKWGVSSFSIGVEFLSFN